MYFKVTKDPDSAPAEWVHADDLDAYAQVDGDEDEGAE